MCHETNVYIIHLALKIFQVDYIKYTIFSNFLVDKESETKEIWSKKDMTITAHLS